MLYKRSSFLTYLKVKHDCTIAPIRDTRVIVIKNGPVSVRMWVDSKDRIDYEEIWLICQKLYLTDLPGEKDLIRIE
jgi:hypothetical protein